MSPIAQHPGEHDCVVVLLVSRGVDDRHPTLACSVSQFIELLLVGFQLVAIPGAELGKPLGNVVKPFAQLVAGGKLAIPLIELCALFETPRGQMWSVSTR